jgi:hypothetical protein
MKTTLFVLSVIVLFINIAVKSANAQVGPINMPEVFDNSLTLPGTAEEAFNMFTDNNFTKLKPQFQQKLDYTKSYADSTRSYMQKVAMEIQELAMRGDPSINDTSMNELNRKLEALNQQMMDITTAELEEIAKAEEQFANEIPTVQNKQEKINKLNAYISGKYSEILTKYATQLREKIIEIYALYQQVNFGQGVQNPVTRVVTIADLYATVVTFVDWKNQTVRNTLERMAREFAASKI